MKGMHWAQYVGVMIIATFFTFFFHEMSHWIAYEWLGYDAGFTLNGASVKDDAITLSKTHRMITSSAGVLFTIVQGIVFFNILKKRQSILLYPFLFLPFVMRVGATWANRFQPNDEGRISLDLGLPLYAVSSVVVVILFLLVFGTSRRNKISMGINLITFLLSIAMILGLVFLDAKFKVRIV
ncbi:MAG TPA: hypothetical protein DCE41_30265 [Cytophagales bacterium]|nr:hypothetical protein [Cytophagales bacterium]HAA20396.1 hypothetical protein [Cytophagales bacterium]HAP62129.1 hypothetical protein [Cytophagales bacterium]